MIQDAQTAIPAAFEGEDFEAQREAMRAAYRDGIAWGAAKQEVFELINGELAEARERYEALMSRPGEVEDHVHDARHFKVHPGRVFLPADRVIGLSASAHLFAQPFEDDVAVRMDIEAAPNEPAAWSPGSFCSPAAVPR